MGQLGQPLALIDSTFIIASLRQSRQIEQSEFERALEKIDALYMSAISVYEIEAGAKAAGRISDIEPFMDFLEILTVTGDVAREAASIFAELKKKNLTIQNRDILIAGTARLYKMPLLTHNLSHFKLIDHLKVSNRVDGL